MINKDGSRKKIKSACWHVNGVFFDYLLSINPHARIISMWFRKQVIYSSDGEVINNWHNVDVGSYMNRSTIADACECGYMMGDL
jgi:hypothetical protein